MSQKINLETNDKKVYQLDRSLCQKSLTINDLLELSIGEDSSPIPLINISSDILEKVILWLKYHYLENDTKDSESSDVETKKFDEHFFTSCDTQTLFRLLLAANYLNIKEMQTIGCKFAANQLMDKTVEEVRHLWNIRSDYSPEEEEDLKSKTQWTETSK